MFRKTVVKWLNLVVSARIRLRSFRVPIWGGMEVPGVTDTWHVELFARLLNLREGAFVDVGMNLGQTLLRVRAIDQTRPYVGFEPNPKCVAYLERLVDENCFSNTTVVPSGLSDTSGLRKLYFPPDDSAHEAATVIKDLRRHSTGYPSRVISVCVFDEVAEEVETGTVAFVKIDVEGHELEALSGMKRMIARDRPLLLVEVLPRVGGTSPSDTIERSTRILRLLGELSYGIRRVVPDDSLGTSICLEAFTEFKGLPFKPSESYDYLLIPDESLDVVVDLFNRRAG